MADKIDPALQAALEAYEAGEIPPHLLGRLEMTLEGAFEEIDMLAARVNFLELSVAALLKENEPWSMTAKFRLPNLLKRFLR